MKFKNNATEIAVYKILLLVSNVLLILATLTALTWLLTISNVLQPSSDTNLQFTASVMSATYVLSAGFMAILAMQLRYIAAAMISD